jgi:triphosphoribosyl-dephospho-CoA synthase
MRARKSDLNPGSSGVRAGLPRHAGGDRVRDEQLERWIEQACRLEATARKPGNVHPEAAFADLSYGDFLASAAAAARGLGRARELGVGASVEAAIEATRRVVVTNTNLGISLLIAPLAAVPREQSLRAGIGAVLDRLTVEDAAAVYRAIRLAGPGGLGEASEQDVSVEPTLTLRMVMQLAADRDRVARQYAFGFDDVLDFAGAELQSWWSRVNGDWERSVIGLHLSLLAAFPDSLIARKCGRAVAEEASRRAGEVLHGGWPDQSRGGESVAHFDAWLRADGHRRNPGTTADLVAATLFAVLRDGLLPLPWV